jgi:hypothetical protein
MKITSAQALDFAKAHPALVTAAVSAFAQATTADPKVIADVIGMANGETKPLAFAKAHPALVSQLLGAATTELGAHPELLGQILGAFGKS